MDYPTDTSPGESVTETFKRKRDEANPWLRRFGSALLAAFLLILVGLAGVYIGGRGLKLEVFGSASLNLQSPSNGTTACYAEVARDDNQITLQSGGDIDRSMTVGVNNPFIITLNNGRDTGGGYTAAFEGLRVTVAHNSINLVGDCSTVRNLTVYPKDNPEKSCTIEAEPILFPLDYYFFEGTNMGKQPYHHQVVLLDAPVGGAYPIQDRQFEGRIPAEQLTVSEGCTSFPLVYVQPNILDPSSQEHALPATIALDSLMLSEQRFEHGTLFYLEATEQVWAVCEPDYVLGYSQDSWRVWPQETEGAANFVLGSDVPDGFFAPQGVLVPAWDMMVNGISGSPVCDLGWATARISRYSAAYSVEMSEGQIVHHLSSETGAIYSFYEADTGLQYWEASAE